MGMLKSLSGNAATPPGDRHKFSKEIESIDIEDAFNAIVDDILCSFGPLDPQPSVEEEDSIRVFLNEQVLKKGEDEDYVYDRELNAVKLFDAENGNAACTNALENGGALKIRYGKPRVIYETTP